MTKKQAPPKIRSPPMIPDPAEPRSTASLKAPEATQDESSHQNRISAVEAHKKKHHLANKSEPIYMLQWNDSLSVQKWARSKVGLGVVPEFWDQKQTKCLPTVYIQPTTFQVDKIKASCSKIDPLAPHPLNKGRGRKSGWDGPTFGLGWSQSFGTKNKPNTFPRFTFDHVTMSRYTVSLCPGMPCHYVPCYRISCHDIINLHKRIR